MLYPTIIPRWSCRCCPGLFFFFQSELPDALLLLYSPGGRGGGLTARRHAQPNAAAQSVRTVLSGPPEPTDNLCGARRVKTWMRQSCWPRWVKWQRSGVCPSTSREEEAAAAALFFSLANLVPVVRALCSSSSRLLAFSSQDTADGRVPPAGSTGSEHPATAAWGRETVSTCLQPNERACVHTVDWIL